MLDKICQLARCAGHSIMNFYNSQEYLNISYKSDNTPVTNVDREASNIIKKGIVLITPNVPIVSEEENYDLNICKNWNNYWLIDPLDGTKEFLKKNGEFTVNICLIKNNIPILGVIYAPVLDILYSSYKNNAWKEKKIGCKRKIHVSKANIPLLVISRSHPNEKLKQYLKNIKNYKIKKLGSSLKFCLIAEGKAQIYPRFGNTNIWDTAAGNAILVASGGIVKTWTNHNLNYSLSTRSSFINPGFYASVL
ncbi:3'(2'),5'-bisphosphate nucleotidase [Buchnera aphidicola (Macrosiphoniella sanborni)]|uniref:3'(2'),5'-bisphosphate nucleotidase CysQ n=1 Tax=Buchnera aphidicola (Macrosiphoniella sanborni) TaxID=1241865 RepID=A0A4D6YEQ6_9GAMM|nr:3'(2'),5'-bisphosphate nucleotidase CysQ [Buchnera aphidicola]QCI24060.1 3'(2'),5'-bisphosphate nucleotidase [Buchnera aphidicola (Macrosiphoniella sanborni)]